MTKNGTKNKLVRIAGKKHGNFDAKEIEAAFSEIWNFIGE
jgi:hypothetical protein